MNEQFDCESEMPARIVAFLPRRSAASTWHHITCEFMEAVGDHPSSAKLLAGLREIALPLEPFLVMHGVSRVVLRCEDGIELQLVIDYGEGLNDEDPPWPLVSTHSSRSRRFELLVFVPPDFPMRLPGPDLQCLRVNEALSLSFKREITPSHDVQGQIHATVDSDSSLLSQTRKEGLH